MEGKNYESDEIYGKAERAVSKRGILGERNPLQYRTEFYVTADLNWYFNPNIRLMFNYIRAHVEDRRTSPSIGNGYANIFQARLQFAF